MRVSGQPGIMQRFFSAIAGHPLIVLLCALAAIVFFGAHALDLQKDTNAEVFVPDGHPAVYDRERLIETFGLKDPVIIAIHRNRSEGVFTIPTLSLVHDLTRRLATVSGIDPERVTSLATEKSISGDDFGLSVKRFLPGPPQSIVEVEAVRSAVKSTPSIIGRLVSPDHQVTLVVAEMLDHADPEQVYWDVVTLAEGIVPSDGESLHVAGTGAMIGYLGIYMDRDARTLAPLAVLLVLVSLFFANRSVMGVLVPTTVIVGSIAVTLGTMTLFESRFYVITNALPVILIGISVDDALHIMEDYRRRTGLTTKDAIREGVVKTMLAMCRPVTVTTLTTAAGCLALGLTSSIPPTQEFGYYTALGIGVAWLFSLTAVPALLAIWPQRLSVAARGRGSSAVLSSDLKSAAVAWLRCIVFRYPRSIIVVSAIWLTIGALASTTLQVDEAHVDNFQSDEAIIVADTLINDHGIGSNYVDVMIEGDREDALLRPDVLNYVNNLQAYAGSLPLVLQTVSYLDSIKQMDRALHQEGEARHDVLASEDRAAQYMLLYSMSGDPADFRSLVNNSYSSANLRLHMDSGWYSDERQVIDALNQYLSENNPPANVRVAVSGTAMVHVSWVGMLFEGHLLSIVASLIVVWLFATLSFRSPLRGSLVMVPVIFAVLTVYAAMGLAGLNLGVGTSMTAAIAIGLSIDFGVHLLHRVNERCRVSPSFEAAVADAIEDSGRAIFFGFLTGFLGFGVLALSEVPGVARFGALVAISLAASFLASLCLLPSLLLALKTLHTRLMPSAGAAAPASNTDQRKAGEDLCSPARPSAL